MQGNIELFKFIQFYFLRVRLRFKSFHQDEKKSHFSVAQTCESMKSLRFSPNERKYFIGSKKVETKQNTLV